jgi:hypothetical protein
VRVGVERGPSEGGGLTRHCWRSIIKRTGGRGEDIVGVWVRWV